MRMAVEFHFEDLRLVGTRHEPARVDREAPPNVAVLFFDFGPVPRSGVGDLAARLADAAAAQGFASFRFDPPGIGDSDGFLPATEEPLFQSLQRGGQADLLAALARAIARDEGVDAVILCGLCAGTWTAVHAACDANVPIAGIVLLEPELRATPAAPIRGNGGVAAQIDKACSWSAWLRLTFGENRLSANLGKLRAVLYHVITSMRAGRMPLDTHLPLLRAWRRVASAGIPILVVTAARSWRELYVLRAMPLLQNPPHHVSVAGTNHVFVAGDGIDEVIRAVTGWLSSRFRARGSAAPEPIPTIELATHATP